MVLVVIGQKELYSIENGMPKNIILKYAEVGSKSPARLC